MGYGPLAGIGVLVVLATWAWSAFKSFRSAVSGTEPDEDAEPGSPPKKLDPKARLWSLAAAAMTLLLIVLSIWANNR